MKNFNLHIVSFNIPYPPNYGGIIDVYYKIKSLYDSGIQVHLHCFDYGRGEQPELEKLCFKVYYYKRKMGFWQSVGRLPYIVKSRSNIELLNNLLTDDYPILFEGLHTTFYLDSIELKKRIKVVRTHNIEHNYYQFLAKQEKNWVRRLYFRNAARKLQKYESVISKANYIAAISPNDNKYFAEQYNNSFWLPPFHPNKEVDVLLGLGSYCLYHGNLSVPENIKAAVFLIKTFIKEKSINLIITGKNPTKEIVKLCKLADQIRLISNPTHKEMQKLITEAQVHLLPTFQPTGIKLKLIASLYRGRHCLANNEMVQGTGLENLCHRANSPEEFLTKTHTLMKLPFESQDLILRKEILSKKFDNLRNTKLLLAKLFENDN